MRTRRSPFGVGVLVAALLAFVCLALALFLQGRRFRQRAASRALDLWAQPFTEEPSQSAPPPLPDPVRRYLALALQGPSGTPDSVHLRHGGTFRTRLDGSWLPIRGEEYVVANPPGFVWWGRVRPLPGVWIDALDRSQAGRGSMLLSLDSLITLADVVGPKSDQGSALRLLGELLWLPSALSDERYVRWTAVDDRTARAALKVGRTDVAATFVFGDDLLPDRFLAERYRDLGGGKSVLTPFSGEARDYRRVEGLLVPFTVVASWQVDGEFIPYARFQIETLEFGKGRPSKAFPASAR